MLVKVLGTLISFVVVIVLARALGPAGYGTYAFVIALVSILAIPAQVGLPQLVTRETARAQSSQNWSLMQGLWRWSNRYVALFSIAMIGLGIVLVWSAGDWLGDHRTKTLAVGLFLVPLIALGNIRGAALRGLRRVVLGQLPESVLRPLILLSLALVVFWSTEDAIASPTLAIGLNVIAALLAFIGSAFLLHRFRPPALVVEKRSEMHGTAWRRAAIPLAMLAGLQLINGYTDILMLGMFQDDEQVGIYRAVTQLALLVIFGLQAVNLVIQPYFARMHERGKHEQLQRLATMSARIVLLLALPPVLVMIFAGRPLLEFLFGQDFGAGAFALGILAVGQLVNAAMGSVGVLLNMTGHERDTAKGVGVAAALNVVLNLLLIPPYGIEGAAIATAVTLIVWNFILRSCVYKRLGVESSALGASIIKKSRRV